MINLLVNSIQALDGSGPATNQIAIEIDVDSNVTIVVSDTGPGLSNPESVFEPFFTTKPIGEGTGLGLFVSKQLVDRMGGRIDVVSADARGTKLAVVLPRRTAPVPQRVVPARAVRGDRLRILVIDDEAYVRHAIKNLLASDHDADIADDGESALAMLAATTYDVILCDLMMPRINGRDVYDQIRARWPGLEKRIVFVTGGAFVPALATFLDAVDNLKLRKPFTIEHVLAIVKEARQRSRELR